MILYNIYYIPEDVREPKSFIGTFISEEQAEKYCTEHNNTNESYYTGTYVINQDITLDSE